MTAEEMAERAAELAKSASWWASNLSGDRSTDVEMATVDALASISLSLAVIAQASTRTVEIHTGGSA